MLFLYTSLLRLLSTAKGECVSLDGSSHHDANCVCSCDAGIIGNHGFVCV